jgi:hypothetical protein
VWYQQIESDYGHDAFLLEHRAQEPVVRTFLAGLEGDNEGGRDGADDAPRDIRGWE